MFRYRLRTLLILAAAAPIWAFLIVALYQSPGFGVLGLGIGPLVFVGIAAAVYRLTRTVAGGLAIAVLLSPIIAVGVLLAVATIAH